MKKQLLLTVAVATMMGSTAYAAGATAETAILAERANASGRGDATLATTTTTVKGAVPVAIAPAAIAVVPSVNGTVVTAPVGASLAAQITDPNMSEFRQALANTPLPPSFDPSKGYTIFAVVNDKFDANTDPRSYVLNDVVTVDSMAGASDRYRAVNGTSLRFNRMGSSYYVDDMRVNDVTSAPHGVIYKIGGHTAATLDTGAKAGL